MKRFWLILNLALAPMFGASAAAPAPGASAMAGSNFTVRVWGTDDGLPQNSVIAMIQTRDGYLWLGTLNGLARFDGSRFTTFHEGNTPGLASSRIVKLFEDSRRRLWVGTESAGTVMLEGGVATRLNLGLGTRPGRLISITEDPAGSVWLLTAEGQMGRYQSNRLDTWTAGLAPPSTAGALVPAAILQDPGAQCLWISPAQDNTGRRHLLGLRPPPSGDTNGFGVVHDSLLGWFDYLQPHPSGGFWLVADGLIRVWRNGVPDPETAPVPYPWLGQQVPVNAASVDHQGNLILGTGGAGVFWFQPGAAPLHLSGTGGMLSHDTILSLCFDREGNLWVGTDGGGLNRVRRQAFGVVPESSGRVAKSVSEAGRGGSTNANPAGATAPLPSELWIGYNGEFIEKIEAGKVTGFGALEGLQKALVRSVLEDRRGRVFAGTYGRGLLWLENDLFVAAPGADITPDQEVHALLEDRAGRIWAGTQAGLFYSEGAPAEAADRKWVRLATAQGLSSEAVRCLAEDPDGRLWAGTEGGGLNRLSRAGESWSVEVFGPAQGLPGGNISALCCDAEGVLWVGTPSGLVRHQAGRWTFFKDLFGPALGSIGYLLDDGAGFLWIGSNTGLIRVRKQSLAQVADGVAPNAPFRVYGIADGLPTRECSQGSQPAACRTQDGFLWFATIKGVAFLNPAHLQANTNPPPVAIESVYVDSVLQNTNTLRAPQLRFLTIPAGREILEIHYTALNLSAPDKSRFRYRMEGHESKWTETDSTTRIAHYTKLPPGVYTFQVTACNEDNVWNPEGSSLRIEVLPPFWRTWWFLTLSALSLLALVSGSVHYISTQRLQLQLAALRQQEALERQRARIARDLHDQLGANLTQIALLGEMAEDDRHQPGEIEAHARQISQTARDTTRALDEVVWTVNPSNDTLEGLVNYLCKYAQEYLALAGLKYRLETPPALPATSISPDLRHNVFLAAKEAVNNIVKHSGADSAWVRLVLEPGRFTFEIEDNGKGLAAADYQKGRNGLKNMRRRMEDVGGSFEAGPGSQGGTRIRLAGPLPRTPNA